MKPVATIPFFKKRSYLLFLPLFVALLMATNLKAQISCNPSLLIKFGPNTKCNGDGTYDVCFGTRFPETFSVDKSIVFYQYKVPNGGTDPYNPALNFFATPIVVPAGDTITSVVSGSNSGFRICLTYNLGDDYDFNINFTQDQDICNIQGSFPRCYPQSCNYNSGIISKQ